MHGALPTGLAHGSQVQGRLEALGSGSPRSGLRFRVCGLGFQFGLLDVGFVRVRSRGQVGFNLLRFPWFLRVREGLRSM